MKDEYLTKSTGLVLLVVLQAYVPCYAMKMSVLTCVLF